MNKLASIDYSDSALEVYLREISKYKIYSQDEIRELLTKVKNGDNEARDLVVKSNLRFVVSVAKNWQGKGVPLLDLISEGNRGLLYSIEKFDLNKKTPFINYAIHWIKQFMYQTVYWTGRSIRLPVSQQLKVVEILKASSEFYKKNNRKPTTVELSELTNIPASQIDFLSQYSNKLVSIDDFLGGDPENNQVCDIIPNEDAVLMDEVVDKEYLKSKLKKILSNLPNREHDIIIMSFGIDGYPMENDEIGEFFGVGAERIRQIKENALKKLRTRFKKNLKEFLG